MYLSPRCADCGLLGHAAGPAAQDRGRLHPIPVQEQTWLIERAYRVLHQLHFRQRKQERERRLGTLILVKSVYMQRIVATPGVWRIDFKPKIIPAEKPVERSGRLLLPIGVGR